MLEKLSCKSFHNFISQRKIIPFYDKLKSQSYGMRKIKLIVKFAIRLHNEDSPFSAPTETTDIVRVRVWEKNPKIL
jgi:hypothetical protein